MAQKKKVYKKVVVADPAFYKKNWLSNQALK